MNPSQNKTFRSLANEVAKGDPLYKQVITVFMTYKTWFFISLVADCVTQGIKESWWELSISICVHLIYVICALPIVSVSSPRSRLCNFLILFFGLYEIDWYFRRLKNDKAHQDNLRPYMERDVNSPPEQAERKAVADLYANNMVEKSVTWIQALPTAILVICKVCYELRELSAGNYSSAALWTRNLVILLGLRECVGATVEQDKASMKFMKAQRFKYFIDSGFRGIPVIGSTLNISKVIVLYLFHLAFIVCRVWSFIFYFISSWCMGCLYYIYLLATSWFHYNWMKPGYDNPPSGIPTTSSKILEIFSRTICWRNLHFTNNGEQGKKSIFAFFLLVIIQHIVPQLFFWLNTSNHGLSPTHQIPQNTTNITCYTNNTVPLTNSTLLGNETRDKPIHTFISSVVYALHHIIPIPGEFSFITLLPINIFFIIFIICAILHFWLLRRFELNDDAFPPHHAMFLWEKKLLDPAKYGKIDFWWIQEMLLLSILPEDDFHKYLNRKDKREEFIQNAVKSVSDEQGNDKENAISLAEQSVRPVKMRGQVVAMVNFAHTNNFPILHKKSIYYFCKNFEDIMEGMTSHRIARICYELNVSSYIPTENLYDPVEERISQICVSVRRTLQALCKRINCCKKVDHPEIESIPLNGQ